MRILMVTMSMNIGGAETHILELCRELTKVGCEITLASFGGVYAEEAEAFGVKNVILPLHTKSPAAVLKSYRGLEKLIKEGGFDIVHAHARIPAFLTGLLHDRIESQNRTRFRFVTTAHLNFNVNPLWRKISRWGERTMAVSDDIADYLVREYGCPREKIHTTINGVDTAKFSPDTSPVPVLRQWNLDPARRRIVYMSRMDADRADPAFRLLDAAPKIHEKYPDCDILLVGGGSEFDRLKEKAEQVNASADRAFVIPTGGVSNTHEYCAAATVFVGVSRSALEAMSAAKPVILAGGQGALGIFDESAADTAAASNFCCRGESLADGDSLFRDIDALLSLPESRLREMGAFNRRFVEEHYTARRMADDYLAMYRETLASPVQFRGPADIVVSGYYGFGNLGDESLLDCISAALAAEIPGVKIAALTRRPKADRRRTGLTCISRFHIVSVAHNLRRAKMLVSGGGSLLQDATSKRSLSYYAGVMALAEHSHTKVAVLANGIGPIRHKSNQRYAGKVVERADLVSVRDADSRAELIRLGVPSEKIRVTADPAFLIPPADSRNLRKTLNALGLREHTYFAVSVRPLSKPSRGGDPSLTEEDRSLADQIASLTAELAREYNLTPLLIPMQKCHDTLISEQIAGQVAQKLAEDAPDAPAPVIWQPDPVIWQPDPVIWQPESAGMLIAVLGGAQFLLGMRLHAIIFAFSAGIPVVGLSYDPKVRSLMDGLGQKSCAELNRSVPPLTPESAEQIRRSVKEIMENRESAAAELAALSEEMRRLSCEDFRRIADELR